MEQIRLTLLAIAAISLTNCGAATDSDATIAVAPADMLEIPFGLLHPQFARDEEEDPPFGVHFIGEPIADGPLAGTFHDYTVQVDHFESRVIGATAERVMVSLDTCREHLSLVEKHLRSGFSVAADSRESEYTVELTAGDLSINLSCRFISGSRHPTLQLSIFNKPIASAVHRAWQEQAGR